MMVKTVTIRNVKNVHEMVRTADQVRRAAEAVKPFGGSIVIKFPKDKIYFPPLSIMYLGLYFRQISLDKNVGITFDGFDHGWMNHLKSFNFFELQKTKGTALETLRSANHSFIPIQIDTIPDVSLDDNTVHENEVLRMQGIADELANRLVGKKMSSNFYVLSYVCREILRNVIEHSYSDHLYYSASYSKKKNSVSVIVADTGEGVRSSLNGMPKFNVDSDRDALNFAVLPGFSGRKHKYQHPYNEGHDYRNSGYGLYMTRRICEEHGNFFILSGNASLSTTSDNHRTDSVPNFRGTVLRLVIKLDKMPSLRDSIDRYRATAEQMKTVAKAHGDVSPSAASMLVRLKKRKD